MRRSFFVCFNFDLRVSNTAFLTTQEPPSVLDRLLDPGDTDLSHLLPDMTFRDRTTEFAGAAKQMQSRMVSSARSIEFRTALNSSGWTLTKMSLSLPQGNGVRVANGGRRANSRVPEDYSLFMRASSQIGRDITATFVKLEKLALLAKKKSLFDDRPVEIEELTYIIKQDIASLNKQIAQLQQVRVTSMPELLPPRIETGL